MNISLFIILLFFLQFIYWYIARYTSRNLKSKTQYFLADKNVPFFPLMMTFLATQVGGGVILGAADEAYISGWPVFFYPLGASLGLIFLGAGVGQRLATFPISTVAQIFEFSYGSSLLKKVASILSILSLFMMLIAQIIASNRFFISLGIENSLLFIAFWVIVILYTVQGGLKAVIATDMLQAAFFSIVFLLSFALVLYIDPSISSLQTPKLNEFTNISSKSFGWLLMPLLFIVIEQDMGQRCFAGSSPKIVSRASLVAGIITMIICIVPVFFGVLASSIELAIPEGSSVLMTTITKGTNPWIAAVVGCAILAAVISTATSLINAISSNISNDFGWKFFERVAPLTFVKGITFTLAITGIFFSFYFKNIVDLLIQSCELSVSALFVPIFLALFKKEKHFLAALLSILFGACGFFFFRLFPISFPKEVASVLLSFVGYGCGEIIARYRLQE